MAERFSRSAKRILWTATPLDVFPAIIRRSAARFLFFAFRVRFGLVRLKISQNYRLLFRLAVILPTVLLLGVAIFSFFQIRNAADSKLAAARAQSERENDIPFTKNTRSNLNELPIQIWQNTQNVRDVRPFQGFVYAATDGGLLQLSEDGKIVRHFTVLDGLTESDLTCLAVFNDRLFIGTNSTGLLAFDGERFENYLWHDREAKTVSALLPDNGRLLIGTFGGGLIEFDGSRFVEKTSAAGRLAKINFLVKENQKLFVGTFDDGLWIEAAGGNWRHFTTAAGLFSNRIVGVVATNGENIFVGTDLGISETDQIEQSDGKPFRPVAGLPTLSGLVKNGGEILAVKNDGEVFTLVGDKTRSLSPVSVIGAGPDLTDARLISSENSCWLLNSSGIFRRNQHSFARFNFLIGDNQLTSNTVSALAVDRSGQIWAGTFRRGIDVFGARGRKLAHLESEAVREINFLGTDEKSIWAATNQGATRFDQSFHSQNLTKNDGLLSNAVNHLSFDDNEKANSYLATGRGLSFQTNNGWRGLTTVNGLPNNSVFTTLFYQHSLFVGTLGGLAEIQDGRVVRTLTDTNSKLSHNWITSLCTADERLFIGTYGGGVFELAKSGELHPFAPETGKFIVNPNSMTTDGERLYVGTLSGAWVLDLTTQKWLHLTDELPSQTVLTTAAGEAENIYFGTTGGIAAINKKYFQTAK